MAYSYTEVETTKDSVVRQYTRTKVNQMAVKRSNEKTDSHHISRSKTCDME